MRPDQFIQQRYFIQLFCFVVAWCAAMNASSQTGERSDAVKALQQLTSRYTGADHLSFDITYKYAPEQLPHTYLDSLKGHFKMHGPAFRYVLDSTEGIVNGNYAIMLFREDKIMYLTRASGGMENGSPLALPDSLWMNNPGISYQLSELKTEKKIVVHLKPGGAYKRIEYYIDKRSGFINRIVTVLKSSQLYDAAVSAVVEEGGFGILTVSFSNYKEKSFDGAEFDSARYFRKEGNEFVATDAYQAYKIFLGNPNLQ